jgi:hypothetical protein
MQRIKIFALALMAFSFFVLPAQAQDEWDYKSIMYLWTAGIDGTTGARGRTIEVDQSFGDVLSNLEFGFMGAFRAHKGKWAITGDLMYTGLGANTDRPKTEIDIDQWIIGGDIGYEVAENVEVLGGARIVSTQNKLQFQGPNQFEVEADKTWVDPLVGVRFTPRLSEKWQLWTRFDIGGFGVGSDLAWQINANAIWQLSDRTGFSFGYRVIDMDYDDGEGFVFDITTHGPVAGMILSF